MKFWTYFIFSIFADSAKLIDQVSPTAPTIEVQDQMLGTEWSMVAWNGDVWIKTYTLLKFIQFEFRNLNGWLLTVSFY